MSERLCSRCGWPLFAEGQHYVTRRPTGRLSAECLLMPKDGTPGSRETWLAEHNYSPDVCEPADVGRRMDAFAGIRKGAGE